MNTGSWRRLYRWGLFWGILLSFSRAQAQPSLPSGGQGTAPGNGTRNIICVLAQNNGIQLKQGLYQPDALLNTNKAFLSNIGIKTMSLVRLLGRKIGRGKPGQTTRTLHQVFKKYVGEKAAV